MDIIVTTPKSQIANAKREAEDCIKAGGGFYFRRVSSRPSKLEVGDRVFYVEDGYVRGFAEVCEIEEWPDGGECQTTGQIYPPGYYVTMDATTWNWIKPIPMRGFQGWRYFNVQVNVIGGWLDSRPSTQLE